VTVLYACVKNLQYITLYRKHLRKECAQIWYLSRPGAIDLLHILPRILHRRIQNPHHRSPHRNRQ